MVIQEVLDCCGDGENEEKAGGLAAEGVLDSGVLMGRPRSMGRGG